VLGWLTMAINHQSFRLCNICPQTYKYHCQNHIQNATWNKKHKFLTEEIFSLLSGWLGSMLDSGAEGPGCKLQSWCCRVTVLTVHTHRASVHQAAKLVAAFLRAARVTTGLAESNGSLLPGLWLMSPASWLPRTRDQLRNPTLGNQVWASFTFFTLREFPFRRQDIDTI